MQEPDNQPGKFLSAIRDLFPGYFALVMATGIVSIAAFLEGLPVVAHVLLAVNVVCYVILWALLLIRIVKFFPRVKRDIADHIRGPGFFTVTAGTCVLGSQLVIIEQHTTVSLLLWYFAIVTWAFTMYTFFAAVTTRETKPSLEKGLSGTWHLAAVSTQAVSVLGTLLAGTFAEGREIVLFFTLCMFFIGCMLYLLMITLIFYRFTFIDLTSERLTPPYWINMGAVAITTLAGARLMLAIGDFHLLAGILPFLKGFTLFFWAAGTWWIPLLFVLGFWRHGYMRYPLKYDPQYWGLVFPLGMYTVCTIQLSKALEFEPLMAIPKYFVFLAFIGWLITAAGLIGSLVGFRRT